MAFCAAFLCALAPAQSADLKPPPAPAPQEDWRVLTLGKSRLTLYGFLRLDALYDTDRPKHTQLVLWALSEDLPGADGAAAGNSDFTMHPRLTRLGMDFDGPAVAELAEAKLTGKLEIDFYNLLPGASNSSPNAREFLRLRHAWLKLDGGTFSFLAGQREDVIAPIAPTPNWDMVMWGAGNPGDRRPQVRPELKLGALTVTGEVGVTTVVDSSNLDDNPATPALENEFFDGEASGKPTVQGRIGYEFELFVDKRMNALGVWGHWAQEKLDIPLPVDDDRRFESTLVGGDFTVWFADWFWVKGEAWLGKNIDDVRCGIFQGVNTVTGDEIDAVGGWVEAGFPFLSWWTPIFGMSMDDPDDSDLPAATSRDLNHIFYIANRLRFGPVEIGADWMRWNTEYASGTINEAVDNRFNVFFAYHF
jgi:hypothetical protein